MTLKWQQPDRVTDFYEVEVSKDIWLSVSRVTHGKWLMRLCHAYAGTRHAFHRQSIHAATPETAKRKALLRAAEWFEKHSTRLRGGR